ncbi:MAG: hypothetical protein ISS49_02085 [Anaerolineae bacterium]|nr:hypothetical protein [Anaerolineae bacterium]
MIRLGERDIGINGKTTTHPHTIVFAHPLSEGEKLLFTRMIQGFYYTVRFSRQFGDDLVAEPMIEFTQPNEARYTLQQRGMSGPWKDLLFAMLANFSHEIVGICEHDGSRTFDPAYRPALATAQVETAWSQPVPAVREPHPGYETEPPEPPGTGSPDDQG